MSQFFGIARKEFGMSTRRVGFWIAFCVVYLFYASLLIVGTAGLAPGSIGEGSIWPDAAHEAFKLNLFIPLLCGILSADRMSRDYRLGVNELQESAPISRGKAIMAKYFGVLFSLLLACLIGVLIDGSAYVAAGQAGWNFLGYLMVCSLAMNIPAVVFVTAFSLVCPMIMPVRVYQVLFTGYWFWGNFLSPQVFPTISGTILNASGTFALSGFFGGLVDPTITYTPMQAVLNIAAILALTTAALYALYRLLVFREAKR